MAQAAIFAPEVIEAAQKAAEKGADVAKTFLVAMEKPIWQSTKTVTHTAKNGDVITRTEGWTIPLGLPVSIMAIMAAWEAMNWVSQAVNQNPDVQAIRDIAWYLEPLNWITVALPNGKSVKQPPSFMAQLEYFAGQLLTPGTAGMQELLSAMSKYMGQK